MQFKGSKVEKYSSMCTDTQAALASCFSQAGETEKFPESCADVAMSHLECAVAKRAYAYDTAVELAGKDAVDKVLPKYEESMKKATELIALYKENVAGGKVNKEVFWG
eukprot:Nitzschia sp. Nitz4//scaffold86_size83305//36746//37187//NITZ4_005257-RA/size83305-snap-gene-0.167-mRNA-1//-1//CDS//3329559235//275//frame0